MEQVQTDSKTEKSPEEGWSNQKHKVRIEEQEKYDNNYRQKVARLFNDEVIKGYGDDPEMSLLNDNVESSLRKLGKNENLKKLKPEDYSFAVSYLIGQMDYCPSREEADLEINKKNEIRTQQAKELFIESCKKIYPDVDENHPTDLRTLSRKLSGMKGTLSSDDKFDAIDVAEIRKTGKAKLDIDKLKDIAKKLQEMLKDITLENKDFAKMFKLEIDKETNDEGIALVEDYKKKKALINEYIYEFMLTKDTVYEKLYGDKNISVEGAKKIDEAREKIENK
ncbi:MAG: hypothetical protein WC788_09805 [Candidatus Paceibacterota bacterium]|jgi:hypothetical protein